MKVGIIQQENTPEINNNLDKLEVNIRKVAQEGAELIVLQELHNSLYFCQIEDTDTFDLSMDQE